MALPKLNDSPKYELVIPSTQKAVRFRPYLVKEEKVLMMAMESQDEAQVLGAITDTIAACVDDNIKISKLTTFDVEYMFIQIRAKSVGESIELNMACKECEHQTAVSVKLDDVKIDVPKVSNMIELSDQISIEMRWPTYTAMLDSSVKGAESSTEQTFLIIAKCIEAVHTEDERIDFQDESYEEQSSFIESLSSKQFEGIRDFLDAMPKMEHTTQWICEECSLENEYTLQGINDFF